MDRKSKTRSVAFRSPDLTHLDFFLWGCVQDKVNMMAELDEQIIATITNVTKGMLPRTRQGADCWWDECRATDGAQCELFRLW